MAPRRLVILITTLLAASILINVLAQPLREQRSRTETTPSSTAETTPNATANTAGQQQTEPEPPPVEERVVVIEPGERPRISAVAGEPVSLVIRSRRLSEVAIPGLGLLGFAEPLDPARFDILPRQRGRFEITAEPGGSRGVLIVRGRPTQP